METKGKSKIFKFLLLTTITRCSTPFIQMSSFPPRHLSIAGSLVLAAGTGSIMRMIASLIGGGFSIDLGFVGISIGYGILIGRSTSRGWALFFSFTGLVLISVLSGWIVYQHFFREPLAFSANLAFGLSELLLIAAGCLYVFLVLKHKAHAQWFERTQKETEPFKSMAWSVAVVAAVILFSYQASGLWIQAKHQGLYPVQVRVTPYNAETEAGLNQLSVSQKDNIFHVKDRGGLPNLGIAYTGGRDGMFLKISGVAAEAVNFVLKSEGFQDTTFTLDKDSKPTVRVAMTPNQPESAAGRNLHFTETGEDQPPSS